MVGLESLKGQQVDGHVCSGRVLGKVQCNLLPGTCTKPVTTCSLEGYHYTILLVDKATHYWWVLRT